MTTQEERKEATRRAIIKAATGLFGRRGFDATTIDDIAKVAKVAKGAVYHHFESKRAVFESVLDAVSAEVARKVQADVGNDDDVLRAIVNGTQTFFRLCAVRETCRILLQDGPAVLGWSDWRTADAHHFGGMVKLGLSAAMEQGLIRRQPVEALSQLLLGGLQAAAIDCAAQDDFERAAVAYVSVFESLIDGLK